MIYVFPCTITDIFERLLKKHISGSGPTTVFGTSSAGWYIQVDGMESLHVGDEKPTWHVGDKIELVLRKPFGEIKR